MTCDDARLLFSARADDALAPDDAAQLAAHLEECADCRAEWARFERTVSLMRTIEPARAPAGFVDRVLERVRPVPWHRRMAARLFLPVRIKLPIEAAAVLLVAGLAVLIFQQSPEMRQATHPEPAPPFVAKEAPAAPVPPPPRLPDGAPAEGRRAATPGQPAPTPGRSLDDAARTPAESKESDAQPAAELRAKVAEERTADRAERDRTAATPPVPPAAPALPRAPATPSPAARETSPSARPDAAARPAAPQRSEAMQRAAGLAAPAVRARLVAADPGATLVAVAEAVSRAGGTEVARRSEADGAVVDAIIPGGAYAAFLRDLHRLGNVTIEQPPGEPSPQSVGVTIRITR